MLRHFRALALVLRQRRNVALQLNNVEVEPSCLIETVRNAFITLPTRVRYN